MSKNDTWMPLYLGDYLADTMQLDATEHGAYLLLLMYYWRNGPLPSDERQLQSIAKVSSNRWRFVWGSLSAFFTTNGDGRLHQKRMDHERNKWNDISDKRREAGKLGAAKTHGKPFDKPPGNGLANDGQMPVFCQDSASTPLPLPKPREEKTSSSGLEEAAGFVGASATAAVIRDVKFGLRQARPPAAPKRDKWEQIETCSVVRQKLQPQPPERTVEEQLRAIGESP